MNIEPCPVMTADEVRVWQAYLLEMQERDRVREMAHNEKIAPMLGIDVARLNETIGNIERIRPLLDATRPADEREQIVYSLATGLSLAFDKLETGQVKDDVARALLYLLGWKADMDRPVAWVPRP